MKKYRVKQNFPPCYKVGDVVNFYSADKCVDLLGDDGRVINTHYFHIPEYAHLFEELIEEPKEEFKIMSPAVHGNWSGNAQLTSYFLTKEEFDRSELANLDWSWPAMQIIEFHEPVFVDGKPDGVAIVTRHIPIQIKVPVRSK